ncbi:TPA: hypothetical protein RCG95_000027 [Enterobacter roggenkampii]|nr:hypothetical protein [Enterobacter roggenkampii]
MTSRYAVVKDGLVINIVSWDGISDWSPDDGVAVACPEDVSPGWLYDGDTFTNPDEPPEPTNAELYDNELKLLNEKYESDKASLATAYLNAGLFDGASEQQKKADIYQKLQVLNQKYDADTQALDEKYGG